ncbi:hypothetical protein [Methanosarcina sp.]|nr:hypothetical protein [Methanosarcina sp.]MDW5549200.1 hypothetical protein [Methanosarcina sp.]MDW5553094.1 hypothetical protein [Methanosarcina sp.]MDW5559380.1 hypothetical protein [Methanosarcina sp.]
MGLRDIYYYSIAFAMMAGVIIAYLLNLDIDQKPNGRICVRFRTSDGLSK